MGGAAFAKDLSGRLGIGFTNEFENSTAARQVPIISVKYGASKNLHVLGGVGFDSLSPAEYTVAGKIFKNIFYETNLNFYTAAGLAYEKASQSGIEILGVLGCEFFIPGIDSLGFLFETGVSANNVPDRSPSRRWASLSSMQGCIFISRPGHAPRKFALPLFAALAWLALAACPLASLAADQASGGGSKKQQSPDDLGNDDILSGPYSEYGEFDTAEDEAEDEKFFQYGRFFGVGLAVGDTTATGNAGKLYQGGFPSVAFRIDYWFDFQFALRIEVENSKHNYNFQPDGPTDVNLFRTLIQVKYYFDTRDLSAPITFIGPHLILGGGFYQRTDNVGSGSADASTANSVQQQNSFGFNFGAGLELTLKPKKTYLQLEATVHMVSFGDDFDPKFAPVGIPDRTGNWMQAMIGIEWTW